MGHWKPRQVRRTNICTFILLANLTAACVCERVGRPYHLASLAAGSNWEIFNIIDAACSNLLAASAAAAIYISMECLTASVMAFNELFERVRQLNILSKNISKFILFNI